jgi:hypothetical protein
MYDQVKNKEKLGVAVCSMIYLRWTENGSTRLKKLVDGEVE